MSDLAGYAGKAGKKAAEMGRFFASEWLREPGAQEMLVRKVNPFLKKGIDQLSTAIRPKKAYKTNRKDLDGRGAPRSAAERRGAVPSGPWELRSLEREYLVVHFMDSIMPRGLCQNEEKESTFTKQSENFQSQKAVGLFLGIITQGHIIHWNNS